MTSAYSPGFYGSLLLNRLPCGEITGIGKVKEAGPASKIPLGPLGGQLFSSGHIISIAACAHTNYKTRKEHAMEHNVPQTEDASAKPTRFLVFKELIETALNPELENVVLFGMKRFIADPNYQYDLLFYAKAGIADPYCRIRLRRMIIPVLRGPDIFSTIFRIHSKHPEFTRYAIAKERHIDFCDTLSTSHGMQFQPLGKYKGIAEQVFWDFVQHPKLKRRVEFLRRAIDRRFRPRRCVSATTTAIAP